MFLSTGTTSPNMILEKISITNGEEIVEKKIVEIKIYYLLFIIFLRDGFTSRNGHFEFFFSDVVHG